MTGTIYKAIDLVLSVIEYAILARVLISFIPISRDNQLIRLLYQITEPILAPLRNLLEKSPIGKNSMFDFSPLIAFLIIGLVRNLI